MNFQKFLLAIVLLFGAVSHAQYINDPVTAFPNAIPNGPITYLKNDAALDGALIYGNYTEISGVPMEGLISFDGDTVISWGPNLDGTVEDHFFNGNDLWVGGNFTNNGGSNLAVRRANSTWEYFQVGASGSVKSMSHVYVTPVGLLLGGDLRDSNNDFRVYLLDFVNDSIYPLGGQFDGPIHSVLYEGAYFAGGEMEFCSGIPVNYLARCSDSIWSASSWTDSTVYSLEWYFLDIHAAGEVRGGGTTANSQVFYASGPNGFTELSLSDTAGTGNGIVGPGIRKIDFINSIGILGLGDFEVHDGNRIGNEMALINFQKYIPLIHTPGDVVGAARLSSTRIMFGGDFTQVNGQTLNYLGEIDLSFATSIASEQNSSTTVKLYPNPIDDLCHMTFAGINTFQSLEVWATDLQGIRYRIPLDIDGSTLHLSCKNLSTGNYVFDVWSEGEVIGRVSSMVIR